MKNKKLSFGIVMIMLAFSIFLYAKSASTGPETMNYTDFLQQLDQGGVKAAVLTDSANFTAQLADGSRALVPNPRTDSFKSELLLKGVLVQEGTSAQSGMLLGFLLGTVAIVYFVSKRQKGAAGFAKYASMDANRSIPNVTFEHVAANEQALNSLKDLIGFIKEPERFRKYGARIPRGVLLYGPPGTGKTLMARALAGEAQVPFFAVNGSDFVQVYVGVGASRIRSLFKDARKVGRAVIFIDEIDAIGKKRDNGNDEREQTLNALLTEMSGFSDSDGIVVLAATNRIDTLDEALIRAGRFDRQIEVPLPDLCERLEILKVHAKKMPLSQDVDFNALAAQTAFFSGAKLESVLNEAAIMAARRQADIVENADVERAFQAELVGEEKRTRDTFEKEKMITAAHEAGHAIATLLLLPDSKLERVSIIPSTKGAAGYSMAIAPDRMFYKKQELLHHMQVALAGRAAEEITFGADNVTTGAANDFQKAAEIASSMAMYWGMGQMGVMSVLKDEQDSTAQALLTKAYEEVKSLLEKNIEALSKLSQSLIEKESLSGNAVRDCLSFTIEV